MRREQAKSQWSDQQLLYISQLHTFTVMMLTGKVQLVEKEGEKVVVRARDQGRPKRKAAPIPSASGSRRRSSAYINAAPAPAAKTAEPAKAGTQKK